MVWGLGILIALLIALAIPGLRIVVLVLLGAIAFGGFLLWNNAQKSAEAARTAISLDQIELRELNLNPKNGSFRLSGEVKNNNPNYPIAEIALAVFAHDCPTNELTPDCETIGQDQIAVRALVPPNQIRYFDNSVSLSNMPRLKRIFVWSYRLYAVRASM